MKGLIGLQKNPEMSKKAERPLKKVKILKSKGKKLETILQRCHRYLSLM
jgi:hypothetical protein